MKKKKFTLQPQLLLLLLLCSSILSSAQQVTITVTEMYSEIKDNTMVPMPTGELKKDSTWVVSTSGGLKAAFEAAGYSEEYINTIKDLKIHTGPGVHLTMSSTRHVYEDTRNAVSIGDFAVINAMASLETLDISEAMIGSMVTRADNSFPRSALANNATITTIAFPENLTGLNRSSFANSALKGVVKLPKSVTSTTEYNLTFENCRGITAFEVEEGNTNIKAVDGVLYTLDGTTLIMYPAGKQDTSFEIAEGVTTLGTSAFGWNDYLEYLSFSSTVVHLPRQDQIVNGSTKIKAYQVAEGNSVLVSTEGFLVDKQTGTLMAFPPGNTAETIVIDGSIVKIVPSGYFSMAVANLKNIIFTEGVEEIGYTAFKIGTGVVSQLEYVELPSTLKTIQGEAFVGNDKLLQVICKATTPPDLLGQQVFRGSNGISTRLGVPPNALTAYKASKWNKELAGHDGINAFTAAQIVAYKTINIEGGTCVQSASVPNFPVNIRAGEAPEGKAFSQWTSTPEVIFANAKVPVTNFTMPETDVTISAFFANKMPYTILNAITQNGVAAIGSAVWIEAAATKGTKVFRRWNIVKGDGLTIDNPLATSSSFTMIDGEVTVEAIYQDTYLINITNGYAPFEAFEGETITIIAEDKPHQAFESWTTTTAGLTFADATAATTTFVMPASDVNITANYGAYNSIDVAKGVELKLYPNPATDYIQLADADNVPYTIYNIVGTAIAKGTTSGEPISVTALTNGVYLFEANGKVIRFIKR